MMNVHRRTSFLHEAGGKRGEEGGKERECFRMCNKIILDLPYSRADNKKGENTRVDGREAKGAPVSLYRRKQGWNRNI